jgi:tetratricopeptide (TPR) repeat protein
MPYAGIARKAVLLLVLGCALGSGPARAADSASGEKYAFLVGVTTYNPKELRNLRFTDNDVTALAETLIAGGYRRENIRLLTKAEGDKNPRLLPQAKNIRTELRELLRPRGAGDSVVVGLAGHGVQFKGRDESYFCPTDAKLDNPDTLLPLSAVYKELEQCKAGFKLLLVDACRNDPFVENTRDASTKFESLSRPPKQQLPGGVAALFSCSAGEKAYEDEQLAHGVFFKFVIDGLKGEAVNESTGEVTLPLLEAYVQDRVKKHVTEKFGAVQLPERQGTTRGLVALVKYVNFGAAKHLRRGIELAGLQARGKSGILAGVTPRGDIKGALAAFNEAVRGNQHSAEARTNRSLVLFSQCRFREALEDGKVAVQEDPKSPGAFCARSLAYLGQAMLEPALQDAEAALKLDAHCTVAYCNRAFVRFLKWDLKGALDDCTRAIKLDPDFAVAYAHRSLVYLRLGKLELALNDCNKAMTLDPQLAPAYAGRAGVYWAQGVQDNDRNKYEQALADCHKAIELDPKYTPGYTIRALNRLMKLEVPQALEDLKTARELNPADNAIYLISGNFYLAAGQTQQALSDFNTVLGMNKLDAQAHEGLGDIYDKQKQYAQAVAEYKEAVRLMTADTPMGKNVLGKLKKLPGGLR